MKSSASKKRTLAGLLAASLLLVGAIGLAILLRQEPGPLLQRIQKTGVLVVATRLSPAVYHQGANGPDGFEYALVSEFARHLGVRVRFVFPPTLDALLDATAQGTVNMAAAGLTITPAREQRVRFSIPYEQVTEQLIYRRGSKRPRSLAEVNDGDLQIIASSSHEETLLQQRATEFPQLSWQGRDGIDTARLLSALDQGEIRLTVADSNEAELNRRVFKHAAIAFDLGEPKPIAWAFSRGGDDSLRCAATRFLRQYDEDGRLRRLRARYFGHAGRLNFVDTRDFWRQVRDRLPALRPHFERAAKLTGIDWRVLAAIGYQESHWRADAVSPTGVRGIMMLTQSTADQMKIADRDDPEQSIVGGAQYLQVVGRKIPERIKDHNRLWLTLAGYNIGFGHLEDARILTQRQGGNPDLWLDVKHRLPLLEDKKHHETLRHGFARGQEAVDYVGNIRNYFDLLVWYTTTGDYETRKRITSAVE